MVDQYFGHKELYELILRAKTPMQFGDRYVESQQPVLCFQDINMSLLTEQNSPIFARGGWGNMPRVIWDERSEVQFQLVDGVMTSAGMGILLGSNVLSQKDKEILYVPMTEVLDTIGSYYDLEVKINGEPTIVHLPCIELKYQPVFYPEKKTFIFEFAHNTIQDTHYGYFFEFQDTLGMTHYRVALAKDKNFNTPAENNRKYVINYYYKYEDDALIYSVQKERFNGLFTLEGKFYSKDENEGLNYTNIIYMPKVRIVSNINLRLGERADPTVSTFNIIGMPETVGDQKNLIMEITRLGKPEADF